MLYYVLNSWAWVYFLCWLALLVTTFGWISRCIGPIGSAFRIGCFFLYFFISQIDLFYDDRESPPAGLRVNTGELAHNLSKQ